MRIASLLPEGFGLLSRILCLWPVWVTVICFFSPYGPMPLWCCALLLLCGMLPAVLGRFTKIGRSRGLQLMIACLSAVSCIFLCRRTIGNTAAVLLSAVTALFGSESAQKESDALFDSHMFVGYLTLETLSLILLSAVEITVSMPLALGITAYQSVVFLVLCNRYHLLRLVNRRSDGYLHVPSEIRRNNRRLVLGIIIGCAAVFLLRKPFISALELLLDGGLGLLAMLGSAIVSLIRFMGGSAPAAPSESVSDDAPAPMPYEEGNPLWSLLFLLIIPMVVLIWRALFRGWFSDLWESLRQKMGRSKTRSKDERFTVGKEYEDVETVCDVTENAETDSLRSWKKACRRWRKLPDTEEKLQQGYHLLLTAPAWGDAQPLPPDTPQEILQKSEETLPAAVHDSMAVLTEDYQQTRYGQLPMPPRTLPELEQLLQTVAVRPTAHGRDT